MQTVAFVGRSGTGKSHRADFVAGLLGADSFIDDGLLISGGKILAGTSAKREKTKIASVKHAIFLSVDLQNEIREAVEHFKPKCVMIIGTSDDMVDRIAHNLKFPKISRYIYIEDVATEEEIAQAQSARNKKGKHVIPIPTFEIREDFSGYLMHPMKFFSKKLGKVEETAEKTIVRPTYSYLGDYTISDNVLCAMIKHTLEKNPLVMKIGLISVVKNNAGISIQLSLVYKYGRNVVELSHSIMNEVGNMIEHYTSINVSCVNVNVKNVM